MNSPPVSSSVSHSRLGLSTLQDIARANRDDIRTCQPFPLPPSNIHGRPHDCCPGLSTVAVTLSRSGAIHRHQTEMSLYSLKPVVISYANPRGLGGCTRVPSDMAPSYTEMQASELGPKPRSGMPSHFDGVLANCHPDGRDIIVAATALRSTRAAEWILPLIVAHVRYFHN